MSAGVSDQRMKGQGNQVTNAPKDQHLESGGEELPEVSWRHQQQPSYAPPISSAADHYNAAALTLKNYYQHYSSYNVTKELKSTTTNSTRKTYVNGYYSTTPLPYQAFGVGDGTWSTNGTDPMPFLGGYNPQNSYGVEGVFGPTTTPFSTAAFGQPASSFNYFHGNGDYSTWGQLGRGKPYDDYYRNDVYVPDVKGAEASVQALSLGDHKTERERPELRDLGGPKKLTWASIASQPAKPAPASQSTVLKKKGPGMPPPPIVPGKHNMDIGAWDAGTGKSAPPASAPPPPLQPSAPPAPAPAPAPLMPPQHAPSSAPPRPRHPPPPHQPPPPAWTHAPRAPPHHVLAPPPPQPAPAPLPPPPALSAPSLPLLVKHDYNPKEFDLSAPLARFFVIKSYSEDDIHRSIKYEIWCSTEHGNKRLDSAFREREREGGCVYLLFSVNGSGHFCGMARMMSSVDYNSSSGVWLQDKWKGQFRVRWIYVKDVPNVQLRHIKLENNENKPVTNSRDTQEVPHPKGLQVLRIMHCYCHTTSIFDDFTHYERRQEEEDSRKVPVPEPARDERDDRAYRNNNYRDNRDRDSRDHRDNRDSRDHHRDSRDNRDNRDHRDSREHRDSRDQRDNRDHRDNREYRDNRDHHRDNRDERDMRDNRDQGYRDRESNYRPQNNKDRDGSRGRGRGRN